MATFFNEFFGIDASELEKYGAFNVSIVNDLPLFIDPFLLFNSDKAEYRKLHDKMISYLIFLRDKAANGKVDEGLLRSWYCFPEVRQNWLGFSISGNSGSGLGIDFARALHGSLHKLFADFGGETITKGSHLEKVCLISEGVGRDNISDFTTNLIKDFLCRYTEAFAASNLLPSQIRQVAISRNRFNFETESWERASYNLPWLGDDFVILTPKDILTRDENWINKSDLIRAFESIPLAIPDTQLRSEVENYFYNILARTKKRTPTDTERKEAAVRTLMQFPKLVDYYIKIKEEAGDSATSTSLAKVSAVEQQFVRQIVEVQRSLLAETLFYNTPGNTYDEVRQRVIYFKDVIENKGGHRIFYHNGTAVAREKDVQILFRLVWYGTPSVVTAEANDGRGPVDFKISKGAKDITLVEIKLAKNTALERNLAKQVAIYHAASDASNAIKLIVFFTEEEERRVQSILRKLQLTGHRDIVLVDARNDNKPSGSRA